MELRSPGLRALGVLTVAWLATAASAQPFTIQDNSLDANLCKADCVFIGTIDHVSSGEPYEVVVNVGTVLKGKVGNAVTLRCPYRLHGPLYEQCASAHAKLIWFKGAALENGWSSISLGSPTTGEKYDAGWRRLPAVTMGLKLLRTDSEVIAYAKRFFKSTPASPSYVVIDAPITLHHVAGYQGSGLRLEVPVVPRLEEIAHQMIDYPETFIPIAELSRDFPAAKLNNEAGWVRFDINRLRATGVDLLQSFKSEANIDRLKSLLSDQTVFSYQHSNPNQLAVAEHEYTIRRKAYEVLLGWNVKVKKPILDAPKPVTVTS